MVPEAFAASIPLLSHFELDAMPNSFGSATNGAHFRVHAALRADQRSDLNAARSSEENSSGSSQAAKCPPLSTSLKYVTFG